jgi:L-ribulose-5-phosphate 3-epimerase
MLVNNVKKSNIGFMQGRLSKIRNNRIQSFPWENWETEFHCAADIGLFNMEWTIDSEKFKDNPLVTRGGNLKIIDLIKRFDIDIPSVTCDFFMENPPWRSNSIELKKNIISILSGMANIGSRILVIPLVDNASLINSKTIDIVELFFNDLIPVLYKNNLHIAFESDFSPEKLFDFIERFDRKCFGINYDIGNSASLGFNSEEEFKSYGSRIINVHVKDRKRNGPTVPLGEGDANFQTIFHLLLKNDYQGNLILQTARSEEGKDTDVMVEYKKFVEHFWEEAKIDQL